MKKIVLYNPSPRWDELKKDISLSLLSIASILDKEGYDIKIVDHFDVDCSEKIIEYCKDAICLGITAMSCYQIKDGLKIAKIVKEKYNNLPIVWGGWHASLLPEQTIDNKYVDIVVMGQGEKTFTDLVKALEKKSDLKKILGISYKFKDKVNINLNRPLEDINNFPSLPYHLVDEDKIILNIAEINSRCISYITSQGCPFNCTFCADSAVYRRKWSALKSERVINDLKFYKKKYNINGVTLRDSNFFVDEKRVKEICKGIIDENLTIKWGSVNGRTDQLLNYDEKTWELLRDSGLHSFLIGAESALQEDLNLIKKGTTVQQTLDLTKKCKKYGIKIYFSFMIGLPPERYNMKIYNKKIKREIKALFNLIDKILAIEKNHVFYLLTFMPLPSTPLYSQSCKLGFKEPKNLEGWGDVEHDTRNKEWVNTPWVPKKYPKLMSQVMWLYLPFLTNVVYKKIGNYGKLEYFLRPICRIAHGIVLLRWKTRFFSFPIEYYLLMFIKKQLHKLKS